eukprot:TRINITY_DN5870_c0_g1_i2.p1 TRINITY_DN5870_c0_g1~~TRINITY_DN5870_c0_g1_i2.p1  ORF type:complete len:331 (+),score=58.69 TRINITY_DN5870_c0_g1_i2:33-1025(+)
MPQRISPVHDLVTGGSPPPVYASPPVFYTTKAAPAWDENAGPCAKWPAVSSAFPQRVHSPVSWTHKDLRGATLKGLDLHDGNLQNTDLRGVDLTGTDLEGADLRDSQYNVEEGCSKGYFCGAKLGAVQWAGKDLAGSKLVGVDMAGANLRGANLTNSNLEEANVEGGCLVDCNLEGAQFDVVRWAKAGWLRGASIHGADWRGLDLTGAQLQGCDLENADLRGAVLTDADLMGIRLNGADLTDCVLDVERAGREGWLIGALLGPVDCSWMNLAGSQFQGASLAGANFTNADVSETNFEGANLSGVRFDFANCSGAKTVSYTHLTLPTKRIV